MTRIFIVIITTALLIDTVSAQGPPFNLESIPCRDRATLVNYLKENYNEEQVGVGMSEDGRVLIELWATKDGKSFTFIASMTSGISCIIATGENWRSLKIPIDPRAFLFGFFPQPFLA